MGNPDLLRATKVLTAMEDALAKAPPTTPASLLQYWTQVRDRAAADVARAETVSVAEALGGGWFGEGVQS